MGCFRGKLTALLVIFEVLFLILFAVFVQYDPHVASPFADPAKDPDYYEVDQYYGLFQDVHVMMFIGFGFLMTFLQRYGFGATGFTFLVAAFILQWATLFRGFLELTEPGHDHISVNIISMLTADFSSATVLISFGALLGKVSPFQLIIMAFFEVAFSLVNEYIGIEILGTVDIGGSMYVHMFGAYFGLAVARVLKRDAAWDNPKEGSTYTSDLFSMIGTVFLWLFWPSFNSALATGDARHRAILNTYFSLAACCVTTFAISALMNKKGKVEMVHIQNATLAGGVAVGTSADMLIHPWGAIVLGIVAAIISTFGFKVIQPFLQDKIGLHDTCGVHNLHGMPGILGALGGIVASALATKEIYNDREHEIWGHRFDNGTLPVNATAIVYKELRPAGDQALHQLAALVITILFAIVSGLLTGLIMSIPGQDQPSDDKLFEDEPYWDEVPAASGPGLPGWQIINQRTDVEVEDVEEAHPATNTNGKETECQV